MPQDSPKLQPSFLTGKCPRCRTGDVFEYPLANIVKFSSTHSHCPHCGLQFEAEPGFYYGAMYVSYAFSVGLLLMTAILYLYYDWPMFKVLIFTPIVAIVLLPFMFRYSRLVMLYFISPKTQRFNKKFINKEG